MLVVVRVVVLVVALVVVLVVAVEWEGARCNVWSFPWFRAITMNGTLSDNDDDTVVTTVALMGDTESDVVVLIGTITSHGQSQAFVNFTAAALVIGVRMDLHHWLTFGSDPVQALVASDDGMAMLA